MVSVAIEGCNPMIPWKMWQYFDADPSHLFHNVMQTGYLLRGYVCMCGHETIIVDASSNEAQFSCPKCSNSFFFDAMKVHESFGYFLEDHDDAFKRSRHAFLYTDNHKKESILDSLAKSTFPLEYEYTVVREDDCISSCFRTVQNIPIAIDFAKEKIISAPIDLYRFELHDDGTNAESFVLGYDCHIFATLRQKLNQALQQNPGFYDIPSVPKTVQISHEIISFFLKYPWLKEFDFYRWDDCAQLPKEMSTIEDAMSYILKGRNEKSIKRALFNNYSMQLQTYDMYQTVFINTILETIKDPNMVVSLLQHIVYYRGITKDEEPHLKRLILFLKKHYHEKQITSCIKQIDDGYYLLDLLREFIYCEHDLDELFIKPKCTIDALHDEFSRCARFMHAKQIFLSIVYKDQQEKAEAKVQDYDVKLPYTGKELFEWSEKLHNCLSGYFHQISENQTTVYGFFRNDTIEFAAEIADKTIIQASGICNQELTPTQHEVLKIWFHRFIKNNIVENVSKENNTNII